MYDNRFEIINIRVVRSQMRKTCFEHSLSTHIAMFGLDLASYIVTDFFHPSDLRKTVASNVGSPRETSKSSTGP